MSIYLSIFLGLSNHLLPRSVSTSLSDPAPPYEYTIEQESRDHLPITADPYASSADNNQNGGYSNYYASADFQNEYERSPFDEPRINNIVPYNRQNRLQRIQRVMYHRSISSPLENQDGVDTPQPINHQDSEPESSAVEEQPVSTRYETESRNSSMPLENSLPRDYLMYRKGYFYILGPF